jgi:putative endopeptidase
MKTKKRKQNNKEKSKTLKAVNKEDALQNFELKNEKLVPLVLFQRIEEDFSKKDVKLNFKYKMDFIKSFQTPYSKTSYLPENNFYEYITNSWAQSFQKDLQNQAISKYDNFSLTQINVYYQLYDIFEKFTRNNNSTFAKNMKKYQHSAMTFNPLQDTLKYAKEVTNYIDELRKDKNNFIKYLAYINNFEFVKQFNFLYFKMVPDEKDSRIFRIHLYPEQFANMDRILFLSDESIPEIKKMKQAKLQFYKKVFTLLFGSNYKNYGFSEEDTFNCYKDFFLLYYEVEKQNGYYKIQKDEALEKYGFDFNQFATLLGFKKVPEYFITSNISFISSLIKNIGEKWNTDTWRSLILIKMFRFITRFNSKGKQIYQEYYGKFLRGIEDSVFIDSKNVTIIYLVYNYSNFLSREYNKRFYNSTTVTFVRELADDLKIAFINILLRNTWMSPKTKARAIEKIKKLKFFIAEENNKYEEQIMPDVSLNYNSTKLMRNMIEISKKHLKTYTEMEGKKATDLPFIDWTDFPFTIHGNKPFTVNAYYSFRNNSITVNLALLQPPFVDLNNKGLEYNLATIGFVIAHELSHALDSIGGKYNEKGELENWWSNEDLKKYEKIQEDILNQYEEFAKRDGIEFNAQLSLSEDLADISGLAICIEYLIDYLKNIDIIQSAKYLSFRTFFTYFANNLRQYIPPSAVKTQLLINPHPPDVYRVNIPLSRSLTFRAAYNVKKGDKMWWPNTSQVW